MSSRGATPRKRAGTLESGILAALARRLLLVAAMCAVIGPAGCIVPTPIRRETAAIGTPKILTDECMPTPGVITFASNDLFFFEVAATDAVLTDTLTARFLIREPLGAETLQTLPLADDIQLVPDSTAPMNDNGLPTLSGTFGGSTGTKFCEFITSTTTQVVIAVTNKLFTSNVDTTPNNDEDLDEVSWLLTCTQ